MNDKRKSELHRRLSMTSVPKPPHDLARRIKNDIPELLDTSRERDRLSRSIGFNLRVAASILLLVGGTAFMLNLFTRANESQRPGVTAVTATLARDAGRNEETKKQFAVAPPASPLAEVASTPAPAPPAAAPVMTTAALKDRVGASRSVPASPVEAQNVTSKVERSASADAAGAQVASSEVAAARADERRAERDKAAGRESITVTSAAPLILPPPAAPAAKAAAADLQQNARASEPSAAHEKTRAGAPSGAVVGGVVGGVVPASAIAESGMAADRMQKRTNAEEIRVADRPARQTSDRGSAFGISTDMSAFDRIRTAVEKGERPDAASVDIEALVNYFAGQPRRAPRRITLDLEGSPSPVSSSSRDVIVRTTIDTPHVVIRPGGNTPPAATNARLEIEFDPATVASHTRVGGNVPVVEQPLLPMNTSVTALYHVRLQQSLNTRQRVAVVRLRYRPAGGGSETTLVRVLYVSDILRAWTDASPRHRLASLGAVWGETLRGSASGSDVAKRAEELARQQPADAKARELAKLSSASSRLRTSAPTGSGR